MTIANALDSMRHTSVVAYEDLRQRAVAGCARGGGLVVLLREGLARWIACGGGTSTACALGPIGPPPLQSTESVLASNEIHAGVVRVLVAMVLWGRQEVRS